MFISPIISRYTLVLLRHGESLGNANGYHQGQFDFPLTDTGRCQVKALAERWQASATAFDCIIASPLARACETAEILAEALKTPLEFDPNWKERDAGKLSGLSHMEAAEKFPRPPFIAPYDPIGETGESQWQLYLRAGRALQDLLRRPPGRYLVVSHGGILNMAVYAVLGITPQANFTGPRFRFRNTSFATFLYNPAEHDWLMVGLNDRAHLPDGEVG